MTLPHPGASFRMHWPNLIKTAGHEVVGGVLFFNEFGFVNHRQLIVAVEIVHDFKDEILRTVFSHGAMEQAVTPGLLSVIAMFVFSTP